MFLVLIAPKKVWNSGDAGREPKIGLYFGYWAKILSKFGDRKA